MSRPIKTVFTPKNPEKYVGNKNKPIICRSSWENSACRVFDESPGILSWASEPLAIPYYNPLAKKWSMYIPDFIITYVDKNNKQHCEMIEIKPWKEDPRNPEAQKGKGNAYTNLIRIINGAKWSAAMLFCRKNKIFFRIMNETDLFKTAK